MCWLQFLFFEILCVYSEYEFDNLINFLQPFSFLSSSILRIPFWNNFSWDDLDYGKLKSLSGFRIVLSDLAEVKRKEYLEGLKAADKSELTKADKKDYEGLLVFMANQMIQGYWSIFL